MLDLDLFFRATPHSQGPVLNIYRYWSGIYQMFDSFGRWYGIMGKYGIGIDMFDCLIVSAARAHPSGPAAGWF